MIFVDELKKAIGIITLRDKKVQPMGVGQAITFYYKAALIPVILAIILSIVAASVAFPASASTTLGGAYSTIVVAGVVVGIVLTYIFAPIGFLISAGIFQLFGKYVYKKFKADYSTTLSALVYAYLVSVLFIWILQPLGTLTAGAASSSIMSLAVGSTAGTFMGLAGTALAVLAVYYIIAIIIGIWEFIVSLVYISRFQNVSKLWAFLIGITPAIIVAIIAVIVVFAIA